MYKHLQTLQSLKTGDRIIVPKSSLNLVQHHAIYLGFQNGQHLIIENKEGVGVRVISADNFFIGVNKITGIKRFMPSSNYTRDDLYKRAISKRGTKYHLTNYNCETFCNDIQHLKRESVQANIGIGLGILAGLALLAGVFSSSNNSKI